ncbi:hypothetical protein IFT48_01745 [Pseudomonas fluorescens]|uniref:hypothetical protein n=1 Tax=Pseudomonas fluorescens TaxID=294 RepID=UPI001930AA0F|nr:hypothetical protein [Pseudomonas fluorescens]MBD8088684.1 hypothetical protein [Pseudomonas fluorescens]
MFDNTSEADARNLLGDALYDELRYQFHEDLTQSGLSLDMTLAEHIENRECPPQSANIAFKNFEFKNLLRDNTSHKLITLLARDGYLFNRQYPVVRDYSSKEFREHLPFFGLAINDKAGLTVEDLKYSAVVLAGLQFESHKLLAQLPEFAEFRQTFPQMDKNRDNIAYLYLCTLGDVPNAEVSRQSPELASMMGLNAQGDLDLSLWAKGGQGLTELALKTFLEVKNPNGKDKASLLLNRYDVMDKNLASLTVLPAQILYLRGAPLEDIMQGLLNRVQAIASHTLSQYPEFDSYVEYAIKRPFMAFPQCWPELGITSGDFLGATFDDAELSDIFNDTQFRHGLGRKFHYSSHYLNLQDILEGLNKEGADFFNPSYLRHHGFYSACAADFSTIDDKALQDLFDTATEKNRGAPMLLLPKNLGKAKGATLQSTLVPVCEKIGTELLAKHLFSLFNIRGDRVPMVDGANLGDKTNVAKALSQHLPEVFSQLFNLIMSEKKPKKNLVDLMVPYGRPAREHFNKLPGPSQDKVFAGDLGL